MWTTRGVLSLRKNGLLMPETPDRPHRTGQFALDLIIALAAIIVSVASLWVALRADQTQEQLLQGQRLALRSSTATSDATQSGGKRLAFELRNAGVGPALVRTVAVRIQWPLLTASLARPDVGMLQRARRHIIHGIFSSTLRDTRHHGARGLCRSSSCFRIKSMRLRICRDRRRLASTSKFRFVTARCWATAGSLTR